MRRIVIFGTGGFAEVADHFFSSEDGTEVVAFATTDDADSQFRGRPILAWPDLEQTHVPGDVEIFVAVGYSGLNKVRAEFVDQARARGYPLASFIHPTAVVSQEASLGDHCFVLENQTIQPFATLGHNVILWSGNHIGHHSEIGDHVYVTSHVVVSGFVRIGDYSFLGVNSTVRDSVTLGARCIIGAGALVMADAEDGSVITAPRSKPRDFSSDQVNL